MEDRSGGQLGNYQLVRLLGKGGFAEVYLGEHIHLGTPAAIKILTAKLSDEEGSHFREEARTIARLKHPNIVRVLEYGVQEGLPYLVMDYAPNGTLRQFFLKGQKYAPLTILPYVQQVASALQFAHDRKLIHRDVKPENMLLGENKEVLLSDFGIAVVAQSSRHQDMQEVVGTLAYMAPEQIQAHPRPASDQYSLAIVIYEWLTGARPFSGSMSEILAKQVSAPPPPIRDQIPHVSAELEQVVFTALAKDPKDRFASIQAFARAFENAVLARGSTAAAAPASPYAGFPGIEQAETVISSPPPPANTPPASNWPPYYSPSGPASTPSTPPFSAGSGPYQNVNSAPNAVPSMPPGAAAGMISSPRQAADPSVPYGPPPSSPAKGESSFLDAPTVMGSFLPPAAPAQAAQPIPSAPPGWQSSQPVTSVPPGWQMAQPAIPSGPAHMDALTFISGPVQTGPTIPSGPASPPAKRRPSIRNLSVRQRLIFGGLALIIILGSLSAALAVVLLHSNNPSTPTTIVNPLRSRQQDVKGFGIHTLANVPAITSNTAASQYTLPARYKWSSQEADSVAKAAAHLQQLLALSPDKGITLGTAPPNGLAAQSLNDGLGQQQVGINAPMDVSFAAGNNFLLEVADGTLLISGPSGARIINLADFFAPMISANTSLGEARVFYDITKDRWLLVANELRISNGAVLQGWIDVAASAVSGNPAGQWYFYQFNTQISTYKAQCNWADYPQVGMNATSIFITATSFACGQNGAFLGADLWELPRANFQTGNTAATVHSWTGFVNAQGHPVVTLTPAVESGSDTTEWLLADDSGYTVSGKVSNKLSLWALDDAPSSSTGGASSPAPITKGVVTLPFSYADPPAAEQKGTSTKVTTGDARIAQAQLVQGHLYAAFTTAVNWSGSAATNAGIYWLDLVPSLNSAGNTSTTSGVSASVAQNGIFGLPNGYVFYPSFVANPQGALVLFAEYSAPDHYPGLIFGSRFQNTPPNTFAQGNQAILLKAGNAPFPATHLGDYAAGSLGYSADKSQTFICMAGVYPSTDGTAWQTSLWKFTAAA